MSTDLEALVAKLANRDAPRTEADLQAHVRQLLVSAKDIGLKDDEVTNIHLEAQVGGGQRIDVEVGSAILELKKDLRVGNVRQDAVTQLAGYVAAREKKFARRYVGVLTDGAEWRCYHLREGNLAEVSAITVSAKSPDVNALAVWLEGVLATRRDLRPTPETIRERLGATSSGYALDRATVAALYAANAESASVRTRRRLWARLLETALGTQFQDSDALFIEHTLLINTAELIAHAALGIDLENADPRTLLDGESFEAAEVFGVVERDFFDWVVEVPGGEGYVRALARRIARFAWSDVEHDVLKVLYESVITAETRKRLGEYYTPDWLAQQVVERVVDDPLHQRVLDPSCGSGTFLFHAMRRYLAAADAKKIKLRDALAGVTSHVLGMDLHPVAVTFARVTCLLAIGRKRLRNPARGPVRVQVFLGDSVQWRKESASLLNAKDLTIAADDKRELAPPVFRFPLELLADAQRFDKLVAELAAKSSNRKPGPPYPVITAVLRGLGIAPALDATITESFHLMCRLHDEGRDHVWSYYLRNLARPEWLSRAENRADVLVGNPPWLAYRFMPEAMQSAFRAMSKERHLWHGAKVATHQDLSALFVVRAVERYLKDDGRFGFVTPSAVLDRGQFEGFRSGLYDAKELGTLRVRFETPWDLRRIRPHFFPISSSAVFGRRAAKDTDAVPIPAAETWRGKLPRTDAAWDEVKDVLQRTSPAKPKSSKDKGSPYHSHFRQGATIVPRMLFFVERKGVTNDLGMAQGNVPVRSQRSANEKKPWKDLPSLEGVVESVFIRPVYLGESVLPYRLREPLEAVIPRDSKGLMDGQNERLPGYSRLSKWVAKTEAIWEQHRSSERLSLREQLDYQKKFSNQFPTADLRIVYAKSGMHIAAALVDKRRAIIDHTLYWGAPTTPEEGHYLCAILNAAVTTQRVRPLMSYGKDERHIDKYIWQLPIPYFDAENPDHAALAKLGAQAAEEVEALEIPDDLHFAAARRRVREALEASAVGKKIEARVAKLLG